MRSSRLPKRALRRAGIMTLRKAAKGASSRKKAESCVDIAATVSRRSAGSRRDLSSPTSSDALRNPRRRATGWSRVSTKPSRSAVSARPERPFTRSERKAKLSGVMGRRSVALDEAELGELLFDDVAIERLQQIFVGARLDRFGDLDRVVLDGGVDDHRLCAVFFMAECAKELDRGHLDEMRIEQDRVWHLLAAKLEGYIAVLALLDRELEFFQDFARDFAHDPAVVHDQAIGHRALLLA